MLKKYCFSVCILGMSSGYTNISKEDIEFMKWLDSHACDKFWEKTRKEKRLY